MSFDCFIGLPWAERGRSLEGVDCWGLCVQVYGARGITLPSYAEDYESVGDRETLAELFSTGRETWVPVAIGAERAYDLILIEQRPYHVGIVASRGNVLHIPQRATSLIERYPSMRVPSHKIEGFYRHEALA